MPSPTSYGAACIPREAEWQSGDALEIIDGDTLRVRIGEEEFVVRYIGIDAPEADGAIGQRSRQANLELAGGKTLHLVKDTSDRDRFGRLLRYVLVEGSFINYELVRGGYAFARDYPPDSACAQVLSEANDQARSEGLGVWAAGVSGSNEGVCRCTGNVYDCKDFRRQAQAQACYDYCKSLGYGDIHNLDGSDKDGKACESLP